VVAHQYVTAKNGHDGASVFRRLNPWHNWPMKRHASRRYNTGGTVACNQRFRR